MNKGETISQKIKYMYNLFKSSDPISVFDIGYHKTPSGYAFGPAVRDYYLIHYIEKGKGYIERGGVRTHLSIGDAFIITPGETTLYKADDEEPWEYCWISFKGDFAEEALRRTTEELCTKYRKNAVICIKKGLESEETTYAECMKMLFEAIGDLGVIKNDCEKTNPVDEAREYIENNYFYPIDISQLAKERGFSRSYFTTLFTEQVGKSPYNYLTSVRIERAKDYLKNTAESVETIALSVGFASLQRFSECFKKQVGISPLTYRRHT